MDLDLPVEYEDFRAVVRDFAETRIGPIAEEIDREHRFPYEIVEEMAGLGLMGIPFPEAIGGAGGDTLLYAIAVEELTRIDASVGVTVAAHTSLGTMPIYLFGTDAQKEQWLPELVSGQRLAAFGLTEPEAGSDAGNPRTHAELETGQWRINGSKMFITNSGTDITKLVTITTRTGEDEISTIIVPNGTPGYTQSAPLHKIGWHASDTRELTFADVLVPEENLLGPRGMGFKQVLQILDGGRVSIAAMGLGTMQAAYDLSHAYALSRNQFGKPIAKFQAIQFKLADMAVELAAARALVYRAAWLKADPSPTRRRSPSSIPARPRTARLTRPSRSTAATATWTSTRSRVSTATRRCSRSARAPTRCSAS